MKFNSWMLKTGALALCLGLAAGQGAWAQDRDMESRELESYTVTATKQKEASWEVPANITVMDGFTMQDFGMDGIDELTALSPNINTDKIDGHTTQVVFRGIGGLTNMNKIWNTTVDGVTIPYVGLDMFMDVERVELLRGGQSALYGRNTHAGVVNVITRKPTEVFSWDSSIRMESHQTLKGNLAFGGPVNDTQGYRIALGITRGDGYQDNEFLGTDDGGEHEQISGRATYRIAPSKENIFTLSLTADTYDGKFDRFTPISRGATTTTINNEPGENTGDLVSPTLTWERIFSGVKMTSITNYSRSNFGFVLDQDFTQSDLMKMVYDEDFSTFTQEFRLSGEHQGISWLGGVFFMAEEINTHTDFSFGRGAGFMGMPAGLHALSNGSIDSLGCGVFGQVTARPMDRLELRGSLRVDYESREFEWEGRSQLNGMAVAPSQTFARDDDWLGVMPSASVSWLLEGQQRIYGSVSRGYKTGDYAANQVSFDEIKEAVDPEYTLTYEVGYKGRLLDNRLELSAALFYINYTDMQVSVMKNNVALMQNAAEAHSQGAELEARWRAAKGFDLLAGLGWLEGEFDSFDNHPSGRNLGGKKLPNANEYSLSLGARYRHDSGFFASLSTAFMGPKSLDEQNLYKQEDYTLVNAKVGYEAETWALYAYGRNLLDEAYKMHSFMNAARAGEPRVLGIHFDYFF